MLRAVTSLQTSRVDAEQILHLALVHGPGLGEQILLLARKGDRPTTNSP